VRLRVARKVFDGSLYRAETGQRTHRMGTWERAFARWLRSRRLRKETP
jgi:hypothetical protein